MTIAYITLTGLHEPATIVASVDNGRTPIAELYRTDNKLSLLLWLTPNGKGWQRKIYKHSENAEKALVAKVREYMTFFCGMDYDINYKIGC